MMKKSLLLRGGRVVDVAQGIDGVADVTIIDGTISAIGPGLAPPPGASVLDLRGKIVSPGFFDIHVHAYGGLAFADPDSIGVNLGTTSMVDAGGAGAYSWDEFKALTVDRAKTDIYLWLLMNPAGIFSLSYFLSKGGGLNDVPANRMLQIVEQHRDVVLGLKAGAYSNRGIGPLKIAKGMANILGVPLYVHIGDMFDSTARPFTAELLNLLEPGDYVTHCYTACPGNLLGADGRVLPEALAARDRGVWFDVGFGSFNFDFDVAERLMDQGLVPSTISSDLQQVNVTGPVYSLTHTMSALMALGMSLPDVLRRVTINPAEQLGLAHKIGSLRPGMPADLSVIDVERGDFVFGDCSGGSRAGPQLIVPVLTVKAGEVIYPNRELAEAVENWSFEVAMAYDMVPGGVDGLDAEQRAFLGRLAMAYRALPAWDGPALHETFHRTWQDSGLPLRAAAEAVLDSFLTARFTPPIGYFLALEEREFVLTRLEQVAGRQPAVSAAG